MGSNTKKHQTYIIHSLVIQRDGTDWNSREVVQFLKASSTAKCNKLHSDLFIIVCLIRIYY